MCWLPPAAVGGERLSRRVAFSSSKAAAEAPKGLFVVDPLGLGMPAFVMVVGHFGIVGPVDVNVSLLTLKGFRELVLVLFLMCAGVRGRWRSGRMVQSTARKVPVTGYVPR